jgi:tRNA nucleotidyltransferase (CCA-adding enzyme)
VPPGLLEQLAQVPGAGTVLRALDGERGIWVVGGAVRDLLLGRRPVELDLVVEGDAHAVARRAAERLGGEVRVHDRFGTATVRGGGTAFDLAAARRETYGRPGALPDVRLGASIEEDLARRDFTVNTLALRLGDGLLTGRPEARADLDAGLLRVLHDDSFADDPTRLLRLARYAARLGFDVEPHTADLAGEAVASGAFETVTGERLGAELRLLAREPQPAGLQALERFGAGEALLPGMVVDPDRIDRALAVAPPDARPDLVALGAVASGVDPQRWRELAFPAADAVAIRAAAALEPLASDRPSEVDAVLRRLPVEAAVLAAADSEAARDWLERGRHLRLAITGDDLLAAGLRGEEIGRGLAAARAALLDGLATDRDSQLAAATQT